MLDRKFYRKFVVSTGFIALLSGNVLSEDLEQDEQPNRPEDKKSTIPDDTFSPSESVSEDYPVPFPTDI